MEKQYDFEAALNELQEIVNTIEAGECSLDESIDLFEKGISLSDACAKMLRDAKQKITQLTDCKENYEND